MIISSLNCLAILTIILAVFHPASQKSVETGVEDVASPEHREKRNANDAIVFTTPRPQRRPTAPSSGHGLDRLGLSGATPSPTNPSPCPNGQTFCDDAHDYPKEHIKALLKKQPKALLNMFQASVKEEDSISINRVNLQNNPQFETLCRSVPKRYFPKKADSGSGLFFVVNDEEHKQAVEVDTCVNADETDECGIPASLLSAGYESRCVQLHLRRVLVVLAQNFSGFITEPFDFPSCCSCVLVKLDSASSRMASPQISFSAWNTTLTKTRRQPVV